MPFLYDFTRITNRAQLINFIGTDEDALDQVLNFVPYSEISDTNGDAIHEVQLRPFYMHKIPKKNPTRGHRIVWEPTFLKSNYKALARRLSNFFGSILVGFPHPQAFGYISGRNIRENALCHCGHKYLVCADIENFFPSIKTQRIEELLLSTGIHPIVADLLSRFMTIDGSLPLGLATSPTISNAICLPIDRDLEVLAQGCGASFSRYADDVSFSGNETIPSVYDIETCLLRHEFNIASGKTRTSRIGQAHYVTGLSVSDPFQPHVPQRKKRRLGQELYYARKYGLCEHFSRRGVNDHAAVQREINRLDGLVKFTAYHEPFLSGRLKTLWTKILQDNDASPSFEPKNQNEIPFYIYVDESDYIVDGDHVLAIGMTASQHQDQVHRMAQNVLDTILSDPWIAGDRDAIAKNGLHFSDATADMRLSYIEKMRLMPFEGYVAMGRMPVSASYEDTYLRLLDTMAKRRLMAAESQLAQFVFEKNDKVSQARVRKILMEAYSSLKKSNNRHPKSIHIEFSGKPNLGLSVPDFLLGALGKYILYQRS